MRRMVTLPGTPPGQDPIEPHVWRRLLHRRPEDTGLSALYGPLLAQPTASDGCFVYGRLAQSLDGRIATACGASRWISGEADIVHMHRLRALADALVIGAGTVRADDPQLTTREAPGLSPVRVVCDTDCRLDGTQRLFRGGPPTLLLCAEGATAASLPAHVEVLRLPRAGRGLSIPAVLACLAERGLRRIYVEGGGITVSRFLAAGALDRLHVTVAPLLLGSGIPSFTLPEAVVPTDGLRLTWSSYQLGEDLLLDIPLGRARPPVCSPPVCS